MITTDRSGVCTFITGKGKEEKIEKIYHDNIPEVMDMVFSGLAIMETDKVIPKLRPENASQFLHLIEEKTDYRIVDCLDYEQRFDDPRVVSELGKGKLCKLFAVFDFSRMLIEIVLEKGKILTLFYSSKTTDSKISYIPTALTESLKKGGGWTIRMIRHERVADGKFDPKIIAES